ncbi:MAG: non-heme iron oxygenase ferredoxin subunit [Burkholderiales bacterium]|nr:non-heme iron oxygenase ferredoxin subunit [Burkholderiales bacterium]
MSATWHPAGSLAELTEDQPLTASVAGKEIGVYKVAGAYYALEDVCPHAHALLSQGFVEGDEIECPLHGAKFHIPTGRCTKEPGGRDLRSYPVRVEGDTVLVALD